MRLFLSWVLNEACRIFNLAAEGRQGKSKIVCEQVIGAVAQTTGFASTACDFPARTRMDLVQRWGESLRVCVLATI